jgi:hypothetical protein
MACPAGKRSGRQQHLALFPQLTPGRWVSVQRLPYPPGACSSGGRHPRRGHASDRVGPVRRRGSEPLPTEGRKLRDPADGPLRRLRGSSSLEKAASKVASRDVHSRRTASTPRGVIGLHRISHVLTSSRIACVRVA